MSQLDIRFQFVSILSDDAQFLIGQLDDELAEEYASEHRHSVEFECFVKNRGQFVVGYLNSKPVACGAIRPLVPDSEETLCETCEVKRMYVARPQRGKGISRMLLSQLENRAKESGFQRLVLETGDQQHAAIALYESAGFKRIAPFGVYQQSERSVCYEKKFS